MPTYLLYLDPTLTPSDVWNALKNVQMYFGDLGLARYLGIPVSKQDKQGKDLVDEWFTNHPAPSWKIVADVLYQAEEHDTLLEVKEKYLPGKDIAIHV